MPARSRNCRCTSRGTGRAQSAVTSEIVIRPEDIELSERDLQADGGSNIYRGMIDTTVFLGDFVDVQVKVGNAMLQARSHPSLGAGEDDAITLRINPDKCVAIADESRGRRAA